MEREWIKARKAVGLPAFERRGPLALLPSGRWVPAYKVPGTQQAEKHAALIRAALDVYSELKKASAFRQQEGPAGPTTATSAMGRG